MAHTSTTEITFDFDAAVARAGGDRTLLVPLVEMVERGVGSLTTSLRDAIAARSASEIEFVSHKLKAQCMTLGIEPASTLCANLEQDAKAGNVDNAANTWNRTEDVLHRTRRELLNELLRLKSTT